MNDDFNDDEYYYDYDNINPDASGCIEDDWYLSYEDEQIWLDVKAKFEKYLKDLMESDSYD